MKNPIFRTKKKFITRLTGAICVLMAAAMLFITGCGEVETFVIRENKLPIEEKYALHKYSFNNLDDVQTTLRSDTVTVTKRNLPRTEPQLLSNDFSLVYDTATKTLEPAYEKVESSATKKTAVITFNENNYPSPGKGSTSEGYAEAAEAAGVSTAAYYNYFKYMLMTQGQHLAIEAARRSAATASDKDGVDPDFAAWLKKHPSADAQYGAVKGENNAVEKVIVLDPLYRSPHVSGLYLPAGEPVTVKVEGLDPGEKIGITLGMQNSLAWRGGIPSGAETDIANLTGGINTVKFANSGSDLFFKKADLVTAMGNFFNYNTSSTPFLQSQWAKNNNRAPWITADFTFTENKTYTIGTAFGGAIHITMGNCYSKAKVTISGAVETPHYILGTTTPDYFDKYLRQAPGVIAILDTENGQLIGPTGEMGTTDYMRQVKTEEVEKLAMLWHSFLSVNESFTGGTYNRFNKVMFDQHVPAGAAVALGNYSFAHPTGWFDGAMNYRGLLRSGTWGVLHEIGHNHSSSYGTVWGFGGNMEGEVRNNALTLLSYIMFCDVGTTIRSGGGAEHGAYANPYSTLTETFNLKGQKADFNNNGYFEALGMYSNIMHSFGAEKFYELLYTYKATEAYCSNKRADFAYRCALIYGMNFLTYFNDFYAAHITENMFTEEQLAEIKSYPDYVPVASYYAGGIDGVKTAGDYCVTFGEPVKFDLQGKTISLLDTAERKGFEILSVDNPEHGSVSKTSDGQWKYEFDKKYTGTSDQFSYTVKLADGIIHKLTIYLRIGYNGSKLSVYNDFEQSSFDYVEEAIKTKTPEVFGNGYSYIPNYNSGKATQVRVLDYYWKSPVSGEVMLCAESDDAARIYLGESFDEMKQVLQYSAYTVGCNDSKAVSVTLKKDTYYAVRILNVNKGGGGFARLYYKNEADNYVMIPSEQIFHPSFTLGSAVEQYVFEPSYIVSKKDNIKLAITGTDKSEWEVIKAPENVVGGRYENQQLVDPDTGEPLEGEDGILKFDKWQYLIDGLSGTSIHTTYGGGVPQITADSPHEFIIDTAKVQQFNYIAVTTRNHKNSYMTSFEVQISSDGHEWHKVAEGDRDSYEGTTATLDFAQTSGRYVKLLVKGTTGGNFSVLAEIDAGIKSNTQRIIASTSSKIFTTKGWCNSAQIESEPHGYLIAQKKNSKAVIKFRGESFAIYAATGEGYGSADVKIDGKYVGTMNLNSHTEESRKLAFFTENLQNKEHTVEIITKSSGKVMINVLGIPYTADILNASNIYLERGLAISLSVFIVLFAALLAFALVLFLVPSFRNKVFGSKLVQKLDNREKKPKKQKPEKNIGAEDSEKAENKKDDTKKISKQKEKSVTAKPEVKPTADKGAAAKKTSAKPAETKPAAKPAAKPASKPASGKTTKKDK